MGEENKEALARLILIFFNVSSSDNLVANVNLFRRKTMRQTDREKRDRKRHRERQTETHKQRDRKTERLRKETYKKTNCDR
jgi:hypothetical protein